MPLLRFQIANDRSTVDTLPVAISSCVSPLGRSSRARAGLKLLVKIDEHTSRQNTALKRLLPNDASHYEATRRIDVAPIASNWTEIKPRPPEPERDEDYEQRLARRARFGVNDMDMFDRRVKRRPRK